MDNESTARATVKGIAGAVAGLLGLALFLEALSTPGNALISLAFVVAGLVWASIHVRDRKKGKQEVRTPIAPSPQPRAVAPR